jgi:hypothetical protein
MADSQELRVTITDEDGEVAAERLCRGVFMCMFEDGGLSSTLKGKLSAAEVLALLALTIASADLHAKQCLPTGPFQAYLEFKRLLSEYGAKAAVDAAGILASEAQRRKRQGGGAYDG